MVDAYIDNVLVITKNAFVYHLRALEKSYIHYYRDMWCKHSYTPPPLKTNSPIN